MQPDICCERSNRVFAMGRIMTKAQVIAASWLRDSTLSVDGEAPFSHFLPARPSSSAIGPHCAIFCHDALVWTQWTIRRSAASLRMLVACRLPFAADLPVLSIVVCRLPLGAWCLPFCLAAAVCPWPLGSVARRFPPGACSFPSAERFPPPSASVRYSFYRRMSNLRVPPAALTPLKHTLHFAVTCVSRS